MHNSPPLIHILSQINPAHAAQSYFFKIQFNTTFPSRPTPFQTSTQPARQPRTRTVSQCRNCWHSCASEAAVYRMYATCAAATPAPPLFVLKRITLCFTSLSTLPVKFFKPLSLPKFHKRHQVQICLKNCLAWHGLALCFIAHTVSLARGDVMSVRLSVYLSV